jgi:hypothetical protein
MRRIAPYMIAAFGLGLSACTNPYDPVQRGLGGGILGAASGAAIGAAAGGGPGAALGAAIGGATGIVGGVATTPPPPPGTQYGYPAFGYPDYGYPSYAQPAMDIRYGRPGYDTGSGYPAYPRSPGAAIRLLVPAQPGSPIWVSRRRSLQATRQPSLPRFPGYRSPHDTGNPACRFARLWIANDVGRPPTPVLRAMDTKPLAILTRSRLWISRLWLLERCVGDWPSGTEYGIEPAG